jgi:hypothetical protein
METGCRWQQGWYRRSPSGRSMYVAMGMVHDAVACEVILGCGCLTADAVWRCLGLLVCCKPTWQCVGCVHGWQGQRCMLMLLAM